MTNYNLRAKDSTENLGKVIKCQRVTVPLTLKELSEATGISLSYLGRIERGERFPSARTLRKIAQSLNFEEGELFTLAGYLSPQYSAMAEANAGYNREQLDPLVAKMLAKEPIEIQRVVISILTILIILKSTAKGVSVGDE